MAAKTSQTVFLNLPYDPGFRPLYLAYIVGLSALNLVPRAAFELPSGRQRLDRILALLDTCAYSIHDLSRVQLDRRPPCTPRFNMPFELGMAVARAKGHGQGWFVFEERDHRIQKSLSDLNGVDVHIHGGTVHGVMRELCNAFIATGRPTVPQMLRAHRRLRQQLPGLMEAAGAESVYSARAFDALCSVAGKLVRKP